MNLETLRLDELEVEAFQVPEVLRCLFHTILFNRALGPIKPEHKESELFDVVYAKVPGDDINATFEAQIAKFNSSLVPLGPDLARGQMVVSFYNKRKVKKLFGFASSSEKVYWEQWQIRLIVNTRPREPRTDPSSVLATERRQAALEEALRKQVFSIVTLANRKSSHIPPINFNMDTPVIFPFEISCVTSESSSSWIPRFIKAGPPLLS